MVAKDRQSKTDSPKVEVGEIDTRAPFQSVKDAVNLFGEGAFSGEKPTIKKIKPHSTERVLVKETKLHLAQKELDKLKERLKSAETTKTGALTELERAKRTVDDLRNKLQIINEAKELAIKATEIAKNQAKEFDVGETNSNGGLKSDLENSKEQYAAVFTELDAAKQELRRIRHDREAAMEEKSVAVKEEREAELTNKSNFEKAGEISKEIISVHETIEHVKLAAMEAKQEQEKIVAGKNVQKLAHKAALEESAKKLLALREKIDPEISKDLETQFAKTTSEIEELKSEMEKARSSDLDSLKNVTLELDGAKDSLQKVVEEETSLRNLLESLKIELENVKKEHEELKKKEAETESLAGDLNVKLQKSKLELESVCSEEAKVSGHWEIYPLTQIYIFIFPKFNFNNLYRMEKETATTTITNGTTAPMAAKVSPAAKTSLLILNCILLSIGNCGGPLIMRLYFIHGGKRVWLSSFLETAGWPFIAIVLIFLYFHRRAAGKNVNNKKTTFIYMRPRLFFAVAFIGVLTGFDDYLYAYGVARLPVSTSALIIASQLVFTALFAYLLVKQQFTAYSINAVVLLTVGAGVLALHTSSDRPEGETKKEYLLGFVMTVAAAVVYGLVLPLIELTYNKAKQAITYTLVLEIQMVMCLFATIVCTVGMFVNNDFKVIPREARDFGLGQTKYYIIMCFSALIWQCFFLGAIGVIFCASSLLSGIVIAVLLPVTEVLAVVFYKEKFQAEKGVALVLSLWGFASYFYGEYKFTKKPKENTQSSQHSMELAQANYSSV